MKECARSDARPPVQWEDRVYTHPPVPCTAPRLRSPRPLSIFRCQAPSSRPGPANGDRMSASDHPAAEVPTSPGDEPGGAGGPGAPRGRDIYPFAEIEPRSRALWTEHGLFHQDLKDASNKFYILNMFPYPSGDLHAGHGRNYIMGDTVARVHLMRGYQVLAPMGFDAFGLPAENAAIQNQTHPAVWTERNITRMRAQFDDWGVGFDWDRSLASCRP